MRTQVPTQLRKKKSLGFTLVELIGVMAVIAILSAMLVPKIFDAINRARIEHAAAAVNTIRTAVASHYTKFGAFADSAGTFFTPDGVAAAQATDAAAFDTLVLMKDRMIDKRFAVKLGDQLDTTLVRVRVIEEAADATAITESSANYDFDGVSTVVDTNNGSLVVEAVITGVNANDAKELKEMIDGNDLTNPTPAIGSAATLGRVKYPAIASGATGTVLVYIYHR
jgi:prepilin-type N-terminal cleavage/methylation domain-containing protein